MAGEKAGEVAGETVGAADDAVIRVRGLVNRFGAQTVHEGLDLDVRPGEILGVVGGSGSGKSVLMRSIIGLQQPNEGSIEVFGRQVTGTDATEDPELTRRWGVLFQGGALFSGMTVAENCQVPLREYFRLSEPLMAEIAAYKVAMVGLPPEAAPKYPSELSGGMRKRAALARALALDPQLLFLDEPTAGLDPIAADGFDTLIGTLAQTMQLTVFLITHDLDTLHAICDRVAVIADRRIIAVDRIEALVQLDHPWVREYFSGPRGRAAASAQKGGRAAASAQKDGRAAATPQGARGHTLEEA
jgi:phospholipid/cholesterol/gamma-HCH transport system ATP-binding protein